ncbi:MAG: ImmA/IrrE family metallo-endopeptidase [Verrucomicrobiota bacterium]
MISRAREREIQKLAREKLVAHDGMYLPVDPIKFAQTKLGILVEPFVPNEPDVSGFLMQSGDKFGIGYSKSVASQGFQNFTVAHELGHYFIEGHCIALLAKGAHHSKSGYISKDRHEREADVFATEFLMPWKLIQPMVNGREKGFAAVKSLSEQCESSLIAASIRYAAVTQESVAVIVSNRGMVEFMTASESFRQIHGIEWYKRGDILPPKVPSARLAANESWIAECKICEEGARLSDWFSESPSVEIEEDIIGLGSYGRLLTILFSELRPKEEEMEQVTDDYIDRWKEGRFRKRGS